MMWARLASTTVLTALLAACGAPPQEDAAKPVSGTTSDDGQADTVFDDMVGTKDRARAVEAAAAERQRELQRSLEQAEGK